MRQVFYDHQLEVPMELAATVDDIEVLMRFTGSSFERKNPYPDPSKLESHNLFSFCLIFVNKYWEKKLCGSDPLNPGWSFL